LNIRSIIYIISIWLAIPWKVNAQENFQLGLLPVVNLNVRLNDVYKLNVKTETRQIFYQEEETTWQHGLVDFAMVFSRKTGLNNTLAGGYLFRIRDGNTIHRAIQQFTINQRLPSFRLAHRFSTDQTFEASEDIAFRLRYRLSTQLPFSGQSVDAREFYLKINNEYLSAFEGDAYDLEVRLVVAVGYQFNDNNKVEMGTDNRFDSFIDNALRSRSWINMSWYYAI
jgi:hypothetical protein